MQPSQTFYRQTIVITSQFDRKVPAKTILDINSLFSESLLTNDDSLPPFEGNENRRQTFLKVLETKEIMALSVIPCDSTKKQTVYYGSLFTGETPEKLNVATSYQYEGSNGVNLNAQKVEGFVFPFEEFSCPETHRPSFWQEELEEFEVVRGEEVIQFDLGEVQLDRDSLKKVTILMNQFLQDADAKKIGITFFVNNRFITRLYTK